MPGTHYTTDGEPPHPDHWDSPAPKPINPKTGQHGAYYVLPPEERAKGFVRPLRMEYKHEACGEITRCPETVAETFAREPSYYGSTFCHACKGHFPVGEFIWQGTDERVGT